MSAGALQSAIDILHKDEHVIVLTERQWYDKLEAIICHADKTPKAESPYYSPLSLILHTYGATCTHPNLEVAVTPQGRFEAMMDFCPRVKRQASDFSLTVVLKDPDNPEGGRHRLGGWVEAKPKIRMCTKKANKNGKASADANADPGKQDLVDGQGGAGEVVSDGRNEQVDPDGRKEQVNLEDKKEQADTEDEEEADTEDEEEVDMEREVEDAEEEVEDAEEKVEDAEEEVEDTEDEEEDMDAEDEGEDSDTDTEDEEEEMDVEDEVQGRDMAHKSNEAGPEHGARSDDGAGFDDDVGFNDGAGPNDSAGPNHSAGPDQDAALDHGAGPDRDTGPNHGIAEPDKENKAEKHDAEKDRTLPNNVTQRLIADLPQLCKQAHYAFDNFKEDVIHAMLTIRGTDDHTRPETIFSDELILIDKEFNPHFKHALHLLTASLGLSYQPSWFQLPSDYQVGTPDLTVANAALTRYEAKLKGEPASPPMRTPPSNVNSPNYQQTAKEAAASVKKLRPKLRSGSGGHVTPKAGVDPAENEATETSEPAHEEEVRADPESSDTDDSPLIHRLRPKSMRSGPATSGAAGAAGPSTKDPRSLAGDARTPAFKALASGVKSKNKFITPKNRGKCTSKARGKAHQREDTNLHTESDGPALPALLPTPINDAPIGDGLGDSGSQVLGHLPKSQAATGNDSRTVAPSRAKSGKRKGRPSSPLGADSPIPDPTEDRAPALAGPSKKRRLAPRADERSVDDITAGPSHTSRMEAEVSAGATNASLDDAAAERVYEPLTAPERARLNPHVYKSSHARRRVAKTAETTATITEPEFPRRLGPRSASSATAGPSRVRDPPPKERVKKNSRK